MKPGIYSEFTPEHSIHLREVDAIVRNGKRRTDRYWNWWLMDEHTHAILTNGSAPTKEAALAAARMALTATG
jgi:hypothetical protein